MMQPLKLLFAGAALAGLALAPTVSQAEGAKPESKGAKTETMTDSKKSQASVDEFEENRRAHMQKSKENNANKGAN